jgi:hypothetical protein
MTRICQCFRSALLTLAVVCGVGSAAVWGAPADPSKRFVYPDKSGRLTYDTDARGDRVPDFSHCGFKGGGAAIPDIPVRVVVPPGEGDDGPRIRAAIDFVSKLVADRDGVRGAVLLPSGRYEIAGQLRIATGGVVLRGAGPGTVLVATGTDRRTLICVAGAADRKVRESRAVADAYVPVGADRLRLKTAAGLRVGDAVLVEHPSTREWVAALGMDRFPSRDKGSYLDWRPGTMDVRWDRTVTRIDGDTVMLDAPITMALDAAHGGGTVAAYTWPGRVAQVGVENLRCESAFDPANPLDEEHAWGAVSFENAQDCWARQVSAAHFAGSAVAVRESCKRVTVEDCESVRPVSEVGGYRRHTFTAGGQQTLFQRCKTEHGRHDFAVGALAAGPNAFVHCEAVGSYGFSGPIESWASGVLYDNVTIDGGGLALTNRETDGQGAGWAAANCVLWQCTAPVVTCRAPPTAQNWAVGVWGQFVGDGRWRSLNEFVRPESLYLAQLADRRGETSVANTQRRAIPTDTAGAKRIDELAPELIRKHMEPAPRPTKALALKDGWLVCDGKLLSGGRLGTVWWRGSVLPSRAGELGVGVTRFVPGRVGRGYTDDLEELTDEMSTTGKAVLEHHWGLWYDRRRDDHQMVRRIDGEVWPPFYEQPWARSGRGKAWDGLSKYDLTTFNPWYFARLKRFAELCQRKGLLLVQQMYFQHNLLEAGAHWADFSWRPANCLQDTGFPEPPPYVGKKRVFMAEAFYDVSHPVRRDLHRRYIRHCLDVLGDCPNVLFQTGEEFTGPLHFVQFWLDTIAEWQKETGKKVLVGLSCTRDVQDAVLADPARAAVVSVIDLKYWWYAADSGVYDPKGGEDLAPRQQLRLWKGSKSRSDDYVARQVREYRARYPDKAVVCSLDGTNGWALLAAGGSVPDLPATTDPALVAALPRMRPFESKELADAQWALAEPGRNYLVYSTSGGATRLNLGEAPGPFVGYWIDRKTGATRPAAGDVSGGGVAEFHSPGPGPSVLWVTRKP